MWEKCRRSTCHGHLILTAVITIIGLLAISQLVHAANLRCCTHANGSCRSVCEQISLVTLATDPKELEISLQKLNDFCPKSLMLVFWSCMNETLEEIDKGSGWIGRPCCGIPQSEKCKMACLQTQALSDLTLSCRKSDEIAFFNCIEKQEVGKTCCKNAQFSECREACKNIFRETSTSSKVARDEFHKHCSQDNPRIQQCIHTYISVTPADNPSRNMDCCEKSPNLQCRISCKEALRTETTDQDIIEALTRNGCGNPLPQDRLWQCFLINSAANEPGGSVIQSEKVGMDSAKLQCCFLAATINCQRLCIETFSNQWTSSWSDFDRICQYQVAESEMIKCLTEVDEPCELGCQGMKYCSNFNNRPTELFRNCEQRADKAAEHDFEQWKNGVIRLPMMEIPVLKITACQPEVWKAIACALQIKPCHHEAHINRICKSDCIAILNNCVDRSRLKPNENPITLCEILSPPGNDTPCISLAPYLIESKHAQSTSEVTHPCKPDSCNQNSVCMVERNCQIGQPCRAHVCVPGCRMGDMSQMIVPRNSHVRLPSNSHGPHCPGCHMVCYCNHESDLEDCMSQPEIGKEDCFHEGKLYKHDTQFMAGCKTCFCYDGEVTCSPKQCGTGLPCHCQDHYVPVCGANGKTYPSACLARCVGLTDDQFEFGACYDSDPCSPNSCHPYHRCVPKKRVCLSIRHRSCKQYDCVNMQNNCNQLPKSAVCDTDNVEHPNICWMLQRRKTLAYYGKCMSHCRGRGLVCGHNGETYASECAAWAERVSVDYKGACAAVGSRYGEHSRCGGIKCPPLPSEHCTKVFPPGGCCPICGAALRLLYSQKLSDWAVEAVRAVNPVVIQTIAEKIREHVKVKECEVFAYLSLESDIIVLVMAISDSPTKLQVEACVREAEKLKALIQQHSPTLLTELPLSFFSTATMIPSVSDSAAQLTLSQINLFIGLFVAISVFHIQRIFLSI